MNIKKGVDENKERERAPAFAVTGMADKNSLEERFQYGGGREYEEMKMELLRLTFWIQCPIQPS